MSLTSVGSCACITRTFGPVHVDAIDSEGRSVRLVNSSCEEVDVGGWKISNVGCIEAGNAKPLCTFPTGLLLRPQSGLVVHAPNVALANSFAGDQRVAWPDESSQLDVGSGSLLAVEDREGKTVCVAELFESVASILGTFAGEEPLRQRSNSRSAAGSAARKNQSSNMSLILTAQTQACQWLTRRAKSLCHALVRLWLALALWSLLTSAVLNAQQAARALGIKLGELAQALSTRMTLEMAPAPSQTKVAYSTELKSVCRAQPQQKNNGGLFASDLPEAASANQTAVTCGAAAMTAAAVARTAAAAAILVP